MPIGPVVRRMFGPYERQIAEAYRSIYIDIDSYISTLLEWKPTALRILEVGCGEGAVTERLVKAYPAAQITAIDITPRLGRLFQGPAERVTFIECAVQEIAARDPAGFDLVLLSDVMHHVPEAFRQDLLDAARAALAPGGAFVFKDWERTNAPIHWMCHASDRWLTGDKVAFMNRAEMRERLAKSFGESSLVAEARLAPWRNNLATLVRPPHEAEAAGAGAAAGTSVRAAA